MYMQLDVQTEFSNSKYYFDIAFSVKPNLAKWGVGLVAVVIYIYFLPVDIEYTYNRLNNNFHTCILYENQ